MVYVVSVPAESTLAWGPYPLADLALEWRRQWVKRAASLSSVVIWWVLWILVHCQNWMAPYLRELSLLANKHRTGKFLRRLGANVCNSWLLQETKTPYRTKQHRFLVCGFIPFPYFFKPVVTGWLKNVHVSETELSCVKNSWLEHACRASVLS